MATCETCGGSGEHLWFDCPACNGTGETKMSIKDETNKRLQEIVEQSVESLSKQARELLSAIDVSIESDKDAELSRLRAENERMKGALDRLIKDASRLSVAAQTTGGVAGRDEGLCAEIDRTADSIVFARAALSPKDTGGDRG